MAIALTNSSSNPQQNGTLDGAPGVGDNKQDIDVNRLKQCGTPRYLSPELLEGPMDVHNFADAFRQGNISRIKISMKKTTPQRASLSLKKRLLENIFIC